MRETQESIGRWIDATFPGTDPESSRKSIRALEECVELCLSSGATYEEIDDAVTRLIEGDAMRRDPGIFSRGQGWQFLPAEPEPGKIAAEAADVLIVLYGVAHMRGFDIHDEVDKNMEINRERRWKAKGDGTGYHIKESTDV